MTDIQIKYWTFKEGSRHNLATEDQWKNELHETGRHNLVTESQGQQSVNENIRHNKTSEGIESIKASASMSQAAAALKNADTNRMEGIASISLTNEKTTAQKISNIIGGTGLKVKAVSSVFGNVADTVGSMLDPGFKATNMLTNLYKVF